MKILVVEDNQIHRQSAVETLVGHEVTLVESFDKAMELLKKEKVDKDNWKRLLVEAGFPMEPDYKTERERYDAYRKIYFEAETKSIVPFSFDVVLTDMMMPVSYEFSQSCALGACNPKEQVPYGFVIALKAALCGAKFVAMLTDTNHHKSAMSGALNHLGNPYYDYYKTGAKPNLVINGARVMFLHTPFCRRVIGEKECQCIGLNKLTGRNTTEECSRCDGTGKDVEMQQDDRKDWGRVLADLTASE